MSDTAVVAEQPSPDVVRARTAAVSPAAPKPARGRAAGVAAVADNVLALMRTFTKAKTRMLQNAQNDVEWAANVLLRSLGVEGPMRASALAESVQSDLSTVSRQVAALVKGGLLERRADPVDGRACLLIPTEAGRAVIARHDQVRMEFFARMLQDWSAAELDQFAALLARFAEAYDHTNRTWMSERIADRPTRSGGSTE